MDLDEVVDELYGLPPGEFTARRDALAKRARSAGDAGLAGEIRALRRPTASAAAVNLLARTAAGDLRGYLALGERLREAQAGLDGSLLRSLGRERQDAAAALVEAAASLADGGLSDAVRQEVDETLRAAVADPAAAAAVASGRLTKALSYAGFGEVDMTAATATPLSPRPVREARPARAAGSTPPARPTPDPAAETVLTERRERADRELGAAQDDARRAREAAERAAAAEQAAVAGQHAAEGEVDALRERLARAREAARAAQQAVVATSGERARADRAAAAADKALQKARHRRDVLGGS